MNEKNRRVIVDSSNPRVNNKEAGSNISWSAIIAGGITFIALSVVLSLIGSAIGFGLTDLTSQNPTEGVGLGLIIWTVISLIISLAGAGFVSGLAAGRTGLLHGFLTWTLSIAIMLYLLTSTLSGLFGVVGRTIGVVGNTAGSAVSSVASGAGNLTQAAFDEITKNITLEDVEGLEQDVVTALENSDIEQLHPDYLQSQLDATVEDIQNGAKSVLVDGEDVSTVFDSISANVEERVNNITSELDRAEVERVISENTELTDEEASQAVDNVINSYNEASQNASKAIDDAQVKLEELKVQAEETADKAVETTDNVMNEVSKYSIFLFIGLVIALALTSFAGKLGSKMAQENKFFLA